MLSFKLLQMLHSLAALGGQLLELTLEASMLALQLAVLRPHLAQLAGKSSTLCNDVCMCILQATILYAPLLQLSCQVPAGSLELLNLHVYLYSASRVRHMIKHRDRRLCSNKAPRSSKMYLNDKHTRGRQG